MSKYTGFQCIICQKVFEDADDIVVCPDCGTPYHRSCYAAKGRCINTALHAVSGSWQSIQNAHRAKFGGKECTECGFVNLPDAKNCAACQHTLVEPASPDNANTISIPIPDGQQRFFNAADPCCGMSPDEQIEGECLGDVASFVRTNTLYYIPMFKRFQDTKRKLSLNLPCILFPYFYFANRKMWFMTILSGLVWLLCSIPQFLLSMLENLNSPDYLEMLQNLGMHSELFTNLTAFLTEHAQTLEQLQTPCFFINVIVKILLCLFGNYLYFRFVLKSVKKIRQTAPSPYMKKVLLQAEGGTNFWNVLGCFGLYFGAVFVLYFIIMLLFL